MLGASSRPELENGTALHVVEFMLKLTQVIQGMQGSWWQQPHVQPVDRQPLCPT